MCNRPSSLNHDDDDDDDNYKYMYGGSFWEMSVRSKVCDWPVLPQNGHFAPGS